LQKNSHTTKFRKFNDKRQTDPNYPYTFNIYDNNDNVYIYIYDKIKWQDDNSLFAVNLVYLLSLSSKSMSN